MNTVPKKELTPSEALMYAIEDAQDIFRDLREALKGVDDCATLLVERTQEADAARLALPAPTA